jgi:hypothetical protein
LPALTLPHQPVDESIHASSHEWPASEGDSNLLEFIYESYDRKVNIMLAVVSCFCRLRWRIACLGQGYIQRDAAFCPPSLEPSVIRALFESVRMPASGSAACPI